MAPRDWDPAPWLQASLLLLWVPGCLSLSGPHTVRGTVGESLSVQCRYEEEFRGNKKYWCENPCPRVVKNKIVETSESEREVSNGRVSIRDHPANLTFTVTFERLTRHDAGKYWCGIDVSFNQRILDPNFEVEVTVSPAPPPAPRSPAAARTSTTPTTTAATTAQITTASTVKTTVKATHRPNGLDDSPLSHGLLVLLSLLVLLVFLLVGASLLAWKMVRRRIQAGKNPEPPQNPTKAAQESEPCYANLELQTWSLPEAPERQEQVEVEYSTVQDPQEDPQYTTVVFNSQNQGSEDNRAPAQRPPQLEPMYSVIKKTQA
ncbi:CMRF35-like molecule 8 [Sturnira hondurensis]|uniref:CMRF35-like molecule 8 n=1 Tax=Sturnira hondurensis TaxID=192404 RepID=UPI00187AFB32|nr:CMRF35-like molecule 8 [Sturnira hondurensis]XP_036922090.1 CMRF35-like molecule 8 [Sturnira hondurensis]XP_036922096.1 CMRF35-like molecule 8 [Sturnira hondurensis]XP_036922105.1 CMRF35-like molecule 8 [Sturnira hondurensis]